MVEVDELDGMIAKTASWITRRYKQWVDPEDVRQEMWTAVLQRKDKLDKMEPRDLARILEDAGIAYCRKEKAARSGYSEDDEAFYSQRIIMMMLPYAVATGPIESKPVNDATEKLARKGASGVSFEWETTVADMRSAFKQLPPWRRKLLTAYVDGYDTNRGNLYKAVRAMQRKLGGRRPIKWN